MTEEPAPSNEAATENPDSPVNAPKDPRAVVRGHRVTRASAAWVATAVALILLVLLIVFILQNQTKVDLKILGFSGRVPIGMAMLIAAVVGGTSVGLSGGARVIQLRRQARRIQRRQ